MNSTDLYNFGEFVFDAQDQVLTRSGEFVPLTPKMFEVLTVLIERRGQIVSKNELMKSVWADSFVEEGNLAVTIRQLRKALDDDAHTPTYIETVARRGYRFIAPVQLVDRTPQEEAENDKDVLRPDNNVGLSSSGLLDRTPRAATPGLKPVVSLADWRHSEGEEYANDPRNSEKAGDVTRLELVPSRSEAAQTLKGRKLLAGGLIMLAVLCAASFALYRMLTPSSTANPDPLRLTSNGKTKTAAISGDGKFLAYVINDEGTQSLWLKNIATESNIQLAAPEEKVNLGSVTFSPDGNYIYYGARSKLYRQPLLGGTPTEILQEYTGSIQHNEVSFSPDGTRFAFVQNWADPVTLSVANADGTNEQSIADGVRTAAFVRSAAWSPDGKTIACIGRTPEDAFAIFTVNVEDRSVSTIPSPGWSEVLQAVWQPDGKALLVIAAAADNPFLHHIWQVSYPGGKTQMIDDGSDGYEAVSLTADGRSMLVVRTQQNAHIWMITEGDASQARQLTSGFDRYDGIYHLEWLNNEKLIYGSAARGKIETWVSDADGQNAKQLPFDIRSTGRAATDGSVIFQEEDGKGISRQQHNVDGVIWNRLVTSIPEAQAVFSPDNTWVVFNRFTPFSALWKIPVDGGEPQKLTEKGFAVSPSVSPDGKFIAFYRRDSTTSGHGLSEIAVMPFEGGEAIRSFSTTVRYVELNRKSSNLQWAPDSKAIHYAVSKNGVSNIWRQAIDDLPPTQVTQFMEDRIFSYSYSPDGRRLALSRGTYENDAILLSIPKN